MATVALIVLAPLLLMVGFAVLVSSPGPVVVKSPHFRSDGRLVYLTEFRVFRSFDAETHDRLAAGGGGWLTPVGAILRATRFDRLPVLFDVRAGRVGLSEGLLG